MKTVFLIGNGFDLNLNIKTRYPDFYEYYRSIHSDDPVINELKEHISKDLDDWSDMELAFGNYSEKIKDQTDFTKIIMDIQTNLAEYLEKQEAKFDFTRINKKKFYNHLSNPEAQLLVADRNEIKRFKDKFSSNEWITEIVTFNYTRIIEKIFENDFNHVVIGKHHNTRPIKFRGIYHIHGLTDHRMIFGVNDLDQLKNKTFHGNQDVLEMVVKSQCNIANRSTTDKIVEGRIQSAQMICIFGSSIGETDKCWWKFIGEQLKRDVRLIIFVRDIEINPRFEHMKLATERRKVKEFLNKTSLTDSEKESVDSKIYIAHNSNMFNIINS